MDTPPLTPDPVTFTDTIIRVRFVLLPDSLALDWAGPAEVLRSANRVLQALGQPTRFDVGFIGPEPEPLTSVGVRLTGVTPLPAPAHTSTTARCWWATLVTACRPTPLPHAPRCTGCGVCD